MSTKPKTPAKKRSTFNLHDAALKRENLRLQQKIAKLEAQLLTATNKLKIQEPIVRAANAQKEEAARKEKEARDALLAFSGDVASLAR